MIRNIVRKLSAWAWTSERIAFDGIVHIESIKMDEHQMELNIVQNPNMAMHVAKCFASIIGQAPNYAEMTLHTSPRWKGQQKQIVVTIRHVEGKTPHQFREEAELKIVQLERKIAQLESTNAINPA